MLRIKSLSKNIFFTVLTFSLIVVLVLSAVFAAVGYGAYEKEGERKLVAQAQSAARTLDALDEEARCEVLRAQFVDESRYTLIDVGGTVLFDSAADESHMENHGTRPEVEKAEEAGTGLVVRYSETLRTDTVYAAVRLTDGSVVRVSETRESLAAYLGSMALPMVLVVFVVAAAVLWLSRMLTRRIVHPIDSIDLSDPLKNDVYEEMRPLLRRMDQQQRQLMEQNEELVLAESMRREFSGNVSHEMKTPLQVISGYAELLKNDLVKPEDRSKFAGLIYDEAQAMRKLIDDVLTLSRLDETSFAMEPSPVDVLSVAERTVGRLVPFALERDVTLRVRGERAVVMGSEALLEEMLHNLVENGIRYNRSGGSVSVGVSVGVAGSALSAGQRPGMMADASGDADSEDDLCAIVRVADTGIGVPPEYREKVFERFFRVEKSRSKETGGTGLGLAIVKHAVQFHGGTITLESAAGQGTTFVVEIPLRREKIPPPKPEG